MGGRRSGPAVHGCTGIAIVRYDSRSTGEWSALICFHALLSSQPDLRRGMEQDPLPGSAASHNTTQVSRQHENQNSFRCSHRSGDRRWPRGCTHLAGRAGRQDRLRADGDQGVLQCRRGGARHEPRVIGDDVAFYERALLERALLAVGERLSPAVQRVQRLQLSDALARRVVRWDRDLPAALRSAVQYGRSDHLPLRHLHTLTEWQNCISIVAGRRVWISDSLAAMFENRPLLLPLRRERRSSPGSQQNSAMARRGASSAAGIRSGRMAPRFPF